MHNSFRSFVLGSAVIVGVAGVASCSSPGDIPSGEQTMEVDRMVYESVEEIADASIFAFTGVVGEGFETTLAPTYDSEDPAINPYAGTDNTPSAEEIEAASLPVIEYPVSVVDPLSSELRQDDDTAVVLMGGDAFDSGIASLEPGEEYLFFVFMETQDDSYSLAGIDAGAFQAQHDGSYANPEGMAVEADEVEALAERADTAEG